MNPTCLNGKNSTVVCDSPNNYPRSKNIHSSLPYLCITWSDLELLITTISQLNKVPVGALQHHHQNNKWRNISRRVTERPGRLVEAQHHSNMLNVGYFPLISQRELKVEHICRLIPGSPLLYVAVPWATVNSIMMSVMLSYHLIYYLV